MADFVKGLFGAASSSIVAVPSADADFAEYAAAPSPTPIISAASSAIFGSSSASPAKPTSFGPGVPFSDRPFTKWYNVHERVSIEDFYAELAILPIILILIAVNVWGTRANRSKAKKWMSAHLPALREEFAVVGYGVSGTGQLLGDQNELKEKSKDVFQSYATGRQNVAFVDIKLSLYKRYNPVALIGDYVMGFFFESMPAPSEKVEITVYAFDGKEGQVVPRASSAETEKKGKDSTYDGFVWAVVHKDSMKKLRDDRYDLSLTTTKDSPKLPNWATVMSESAEITDTLLTQDLVKAIEGCGEDLEALVVTDMPEDAPKTLNELVPKKRLSLSMRLTSSGTPQSLALFQAFLRLPDHLVSSAHFRAEVLRRVKATREEVSKKIKKLDDEEKAEERKTLSDKAKKDERERKLKGLSAEDQRKFLEKEREKDQRRRQGKKTMKA